MIQHSKNGRKAELRNLRVVAILVSVLISSGCASVSGEPDEYAAYGYLSPGPTSEPQLIGVYKTVRACETAANEWTTRQVVGNPIYAECYPVDRD